MQYYLAVDIGASSGRHILGHIENGRLVWEEIYRFSNGVYEKDGHFFWDIRKLYASIIEGMQAAAQTGNIPVSMAIDTWAVDYVLLDEQDRLISDPWAYRDARTESVIGRVHEIIPQTDLYHQSGIQFQPFNTIYQLKAEKELSPDWSFLMIPDYLNYLLTGRKSNEFTNMTTTQLLDTNGELNRSLLQRLEIPEELFQDLLDPGTVLGTLKSEVAETVGFDCQVHVCSSHDTGSAYMASVAPGLILSSGTWSLLGTERPAVDTSLEACAANFTNEGGYGRNYRFLKNVMGLWIIQEVRRNLQDSYSFAQLVQEAEKSTYIHVFDVNDHRFLKPNHMMNEITAWFEEAGLEPPVTVGDYARTVYLSLADTLSQACRQLEEVTEDRYSSINIIGGGCQNELLNQMIADASGKKVYAGPVEATAIGNLMAQMITNNECRDLEEARRLVMESETVRIYRPGKEYTNA